MIRAPSEKPLNRYSPNQETSAFYGTQIPITTFIRACNLSLSWEKLIQSTLPILFHKDKFNIIFLSTSMPKFYKFYISFIFLHQSPVHASPVPLRVTYRAHYILLHVITPVTFGKRHKPWSPSTSALNKCSHLLINVANLLVKNYVTKDPQFRYLTQN